MKTIHAKDLKSLITSGHELAILDVREEGVYSEGHLLYASSLPLSKLEPSIFQLVPRKGAPIALCDDGDGLSERAAERLAEFGYTDVAVLENGMQGWRDAGHEVFSGINVPSKAFGEIVEHEQQTPNISAEELKAKLDAGDDLVVLDSRPYDEYHRMNIPTGLDVPGAELVHRVHDVAPSPDTLVVVNCAGRTRSIIGAQSLINAGIPNKVMALKNGTMGWNLAGYDLEHGSERRVLSSTEAGTAKATEAARRVAEKYGVRTITMDDLSAWQEETDQRTLYLFDIRNPEEFEAGHLSGSVWAPGGQLVQGTDKYAPVRNSRVVLIDDNGVRATMTAHWLIQMGWNDVVVLKGGLDSGKLETGKYQPVVAGLNRADADAISAADLNALLPDGATVLDLGRSLDFKAGHIPGAWFGVRSRLKTALDNVDIAGELVTTSDDGILARFAAAEASALLGQPVRYLDGGTNAWQAAGFVLEDGDGRQADEMNDMFLRPYDRASGIEQAMNDYLTWEIELVNQLERDGTTNFKLFN